MDVVTLVMLGPTFAGDWLVAFGKWTESKARIARGASTDELLLRRLDRLEEDVARIRGHLADLPALSGERVGKPDGGA